MRHRLTHGVIRYNIKYKYYEKFLIIMRCVFEIIFNNTSDLHPFLQMNIGGRRGRDRNQCISPRKL